MLKEKTVVMLPTNNKATVQGQLCLNGTHLFTARASDDVGLLSPQYLYITSDEEIKEGFSGYAIVTVKDDTRIHYLVNVIITEKNQCYCDEDRKFSFQYYSVVPIIATTDKSLLLSDISFKDWDGKPRTLPNLSDGFKSKYAEVYNTGKPITKIGVEYEEDYSVPCAITATNCERFQSDVGDCKGCPHCTLKLKVDKNNCITTRPVKKEYTRGDMINKLDSYKYYLEQKYGYSLSAFSDEDARWIEDNL